MAASDVEELYADGLAFHTVKYPSPFFDLSKTYFPKSIKQLFRWCRYFFYKSAIINNIVHKKAEYPVTTLIVDEEDQEKKNAWEEILNKKLNLKPFLVYCGLDYFAMGNCIVSIVKPFKRFLVCPKCKTERLITDRKFKWKNFKLVGKCPDCNANVNYLVKDQDYKNINQLKLKRWNPDNIEIEYEEVTDTRKYIYTIPKKTIQAITKGDRAILNNIPWIFVEAVEKKKKVELDSHHLFHFKKEGLSEMSTEWGKPDILAALPLVYYLFVLKRAQEAIAVERTVPLRVLFPKSGEGLNPYQDLNLSSWKKDVESQVKLWKKDPNHIGIMPIPVGYQNIGGESKALLLTQEIDNTQKEIVISMGCTVEFVYGGASWSGSSVSLRIIENGFINYREHGLYNLIDFIVNEVAGFMGIKPAKVNLSDFKMADDVQRKQLIYQMTGNDLISHDTLMDNMDLDYEQEIKKMEDQIDDKAKLALKKAMGETEVEGEKRLKEIDYEKKFEEAKRRLAGELEMKKGQPKQMALDEMIEKHIAELQDMDPRIRKQMFEQMKEQMPNYTQALLEKLHEKKGGGEEQESQEISSQESSEEGETFPSSDDKKENGEKKEKKPEESSNKEMKPLPEQKPPRRQASPI